MDESDEGLIRFLMRERHGCYDERTEVLTQSGWKRWPEVTGQELFATRSVEGRLEYQPALRVVHKEFRGHMIGFKGMSIDLLTTPDHRVLAESTTTRLGRIEPRFGLRPAHSVLWRSHRHISTAEWPGPRPSTGFTSTTFLSPPFPCFGWSVSSSGTGLCRTRITSSSTCEKHARSTSSDVPPPRQHSSSRIGAVVLRYPSCPSCDSSLPSATKIEKRSSRRQLLELGSPLLEALYEGLLASDGSRYIRERGADREAYTTTSLQLADAVQELALKLGRSATVRPHLARKATDTMGGSLVGE